MCFLQRIRKRRESLVTKTLRKGGNALDGRRRRRRRRFRLGRSSRQRGLVGAWVFSSTPKVETMGQGLDEEGGGESEGETEGRGRREWQRESERVREGWVRRLTAIDFSRQTRGLFVPLSILYYPSTSLSFSLSLPRLTTFLHLSPSSYSRSSFFLPSSTLSFLLSFARHASSSYPLANSRDIFPQFYIYIYTVMRMHAQSHGNIQRIIDACKRSFLHPLLSVRRPLTPWFSHPVLYPRRIYHEIGEVGRGLQPRFRLIGDDRLAREKQVLFPDFLFFFSNSIPHVFPSIRFRNGVVGVEGGAQRFFFLPSSFSSAT